MAKVNYINHHKNANAKLISDNVSSIDIAIYNALFLLWNSNNFCDTLSLNRSEVMSLSKVGNANTYTKSLKKLHELKYIIYKPSHNPLIGSKITMCRYDISGGKSSDISGGKATDISSGSSDDTLYKQYNKLTKEQIKHILDFFNSQEDIDSVILKLKDSKNGKGFNFYNSLISLGANEQLAKDWIAVRKNKKATNTETALNSFNNQVILSNKSIDVILQLCIEKSWSGFNAKWLDKISIPNDPLENAEDRARRERIENAKNNY